MLEALLSLTSGCSLAMLKNVVAVVGLGNGQEVEDVVTGVDEVDCYSQLEVRLLKMVASIFSLKEMISQVKHKKEVAEVTEAWK